MAQSKVWQFFSPNTKNTSAVCNLCNQVIKHSKSTTCLWNHYNSQHKPENGVDVVCKRVQIDSDTSDVDQNGEISEQISSNIPTLDSDYSNCVPSTSSSSSSSLTPYHCTTKKVRTARSLIKRVSSIVSAFKHSYKRSNALENVLEQLGKPKLSLIQSCPTRWNSTMFMLERLLAIGQGIVTVMATYAFYSTTSQKVRVH
ncbi:hypothetical protein QTP88_028729 [Uroleucon formosanum]